MTVHSEQNELTGIISRMCETLLSTISTRGEAEAALRFRIGQFRVNALQLLRLKTFADELLGIFADARALPVSALAVARVRTQLMNETPSGEVGTSVVQTGIVYCLATESRLISVMVFASQDDVENMIVRMRSAFNSAREMAADAMDSASYQLMTTLAGSLMNHLASVARQLPRIIKMEFNDHFPSLYLGQRVYQDASRYEELAAENKAIHPLFMQRSLTGLAE